MSRFVLSLRKTGLGDRLICLCAAWIYARSTGRTLIADWRYSRYLANVENLFPHVFIPRQCLGGVDFNGEARLDTSELPLPTHPVAWGRPDLIAAPWKAAADAFPLERSRALTLIRNAADVDAATVVFNACLSDAVERFADAHDFLNALEPQPSYCAEASAFDAKYFGAGIRIGLHIRHGNGGNIMGHTPSWRSHAAAIKRCRDAVEYARGKLGQQTPVFLATDSAEVEKEIKAQIAGVISRPKVFRPAGAGELHLGPEAPDGLQDAIIDMLLLSRSDVLIRYPAASFFSFYPAVMKRRLGSAPELLSDLQIPFDQSDPLSPAVLF